jgi:hypothetical protein
LFTRCGRHGLVRNFVYTDEQARHLAVHSRGVLEALRTLYDVKELAKELIGALGPSLARQASSNPGSAGHQPDAQAKVKLYGLRWRVRLVGLDVRPKVHCRRSPQ